MSSNLENIVDLKYKARFHVMYWLVEFIDVEVNEAEGTTVDAPSMKGSLTAILMGGTSAKTTGSINLSTQTITVGYIENDAINFSSGGPSSMADTIILKNQCSFPVLFQISPEGGALQQYTVGPLQQFPMSLERMFTAYARVHDYPNEPAGSDGYDTPTVSFASTDVTLTVWSNGTDGESFHIDVT